MNLKYTLCFIRDDGDVLMVLRNSDPYANMWNGLGGSIRDGETPKEAVIREVREESGVRLEEVTFGGIVTWPRDDGIEGMYVYTADLPEHKTWFSAMQFPSPAGFLDWIEEERVADESDTAIIDNIPHFLPPMLAGAEPMEYHCTYHPDGSLAGVERRPLSISLEGVV